jgi:uncharacterized protein involved in exopolysaccharide biosynthesis
MNMIQEKTKPAYVAADNGEWNILEFFLILARRKKVVIGLPLAGAVLSIAVSLMLPNIFKATTTLLPPQQSQSGASALLSQLGGVANAAAGIAGIKNPNDLYVGMLKSRTVADRLVARFNLIKVYDADSQEQARQMLADNTSIVAGKDGLITLDFESKDKKLVAEVANAYVDELLSLTKTLAITEAAKRRLFFEQQLQATKDNLANAEAALKGAIDAKGVVSVDAESRSIVETVGRLRAQISAKEIQLNSMQAFVTSNNPDYKRVQEELASLKSELSKLESGRAQNDNEPPQTAGGLQNIKLLRDVKYFQMLYELLAKQYEVARLDEAKDTAIVQVLDKAVVPEKKYKPKRSMIVFFSTVLCVLLGVFWAIFSEAKRKMIQDPDGALLWNDLKSKIRFR